MGQAAGGGKFVKLVSAVLPAAVVAGSLTFTGIEGKPAATVGMAWTPTATVVVIGGMGWETVDEPVMRAILDSRYDQPENTFVNIEWPAYLGTLGDSVTEASDSLYTHVMATEGPQVVIGVSGSTFVANEVMRRLTVDPSPDKPTPGDISFVIIGDGERGFIPAVVPFTGWDLPLVNYTAQPVPVTPYDAIVVKGEYDGLADWPDRPWNLLAVVNALAGSPAIDHGQIHWESIWYDIDTLPAENITTEVNAAGGTTTTYLVPTAELPMLYPLHEMGVPEPAIGALNSVLKPVVDVGYSRNDPAWLNPTGGDWARQSARLRQPPAGSPAAGARTPQPAQTPQVARPERIKAGNDRGAVSRAAATTR